MRIVYPKKIAIGVDIGGTKIKAGLVDINPRIYPDFSARTR